MAVGGGSISESCKFIAMAGFHDSNPYDPFVKGVSSCTRAVPLGVIMALPATGSESNNGCEISCRRTYGKCGMKKACACIQRIDDFYSKVMGVPTHISEYLQYSQDKAQIEEVHKKLSNALLGEDGDIDAVAACEIIRKSY